MSKIFTAIIMITALCCAWSATVFAHVPHDVVVDLKLSPSFSHDKTIFAIIYWSLFKSTDGGYNWYRQAKGLCPHEPMALAISPAFSLDKTIFVSCIKGDIYRSQNTGQSWSLVRTNTDITGDNNCFVHLSISPLFGTDHTVLALNSKGSIYQTVDGGENWKQVFHKELEITAVDWAGKRIMVGTNLGELYVSNDCGRYWEKFSQLSTRQKITCIKLPCGFASSEPFFIGTEQDGVLRVMNGGRTFENASNGLSEKYITALDSLYEGGQLVLLASTGAEALFYSDDNGASWKKNESGLLKNYQAVEYLQPHFSKIAVADNGEIYLGGFCGIFRSSNRT